MKSFISLIAVLGSLTATQGQIFFFANLDPGSEVPPHSDSALGDARFTLGGSTLTVDTGIYQNLSSGPQVITLDFGAAGVNGTSITVLHIDTPGMTTGTFSGSVLLTPPDINALDLGKFYVNVSDSAFPDGDIRGQLEPTPEPSTLALFGVGMVALIVAQIRRRSLRISDASI